ncbi:DUF4383 domain-containing protein [Natronosporangium hydrolyticum]|uniref:DUF4383 domain-containing protein n=1 Tax=Natronosporangium hydrolyticum TaxID=2811111 RepID=A0A895YJA4_9ACTN|nr:DUF4383 domain-containing protein [Natronosporangium hydrolyticum]QSB15443.1 DUF4383 domain-containing protein [Natronosporangium hydrolyticum]
MSHIPVNHPLRPLYRGVAIVIAGWLVTFGVVGLVQTQGEDWLGRGDWSALGIPTNGGFSVVCLVAGVVILLTSVIGRNLDRMANFWLGGGFLVIGTAMMALVATEGNVFNFSSVTTSMAYLVGVGLIAAGLYGKVGPASDTSVRPDVPAPAGGDAPAIPAQDAGTEPVATGAVNEGRPTAP